MKDWIKNRMSLACGCDACNKGRDLMKAIDSEIKLKTLDPVKGTYNES